VELALKEKKLKIMKVLACKLQDGPILAALDKFCNRCFNKNIPLSLCYEVACGDREQKVLDIVK